MYSDQDKSWPIFLEKSCKLVKTYPGYCMCMCRASLRFEKRLNFSINPRKLSIFSLFFVNNFPYNNTTEVDSYIRICYSHFPHPFSILNTPLFSSTPLTPQNVEESSAISVQATGVTGNRRPDIKYKNNEFYLDVLEDINMLVSSRGLRFTEVFSDSAY